MILIQECTTRKNAYNKYLVDTDTNENTLLKTVNITSATRPNVKRDYIILYDTNMNPISEAFEFLNYEYLTCSNNTKYQALTALRLLYSFLELFDLNIENLTGEDINNLKYFLRGMSPKGKFISIDLNTERISDTINIYLSIYRKYTKFLGLEDSELNKISPFSVTLYDPRTEIKVKYEQYEYNERVTKREKLPKYITLPEYKRILDCIDAEYTLREKCIVRLMYEGGLRIGEVLGLTAEDVKRKEYTNKQTGENFESGVIYFRNRITDKRYQLCKRHIIPTNKRTYSTRAYKDDVDKAFISTDLVDMIDDYINDKHDSYYRKSDLSKARFESNYKKYTETHIVNYSENLDAEHNNILDTNYYIFINSLGKPLNISTWNKILREIFKKCDIKLDINKKEHNLNHRFRHGFAMFMRQYKKVSLMDLKKLMRHASISSTEIYDNPSDEDIAAIKKDYSETLEELLPMVLEGDFE